MPAELVNAFEAEAHRLDAAADNADPDGKGKSSHKAQVQREVAEVLRNLGQRVQGIDPALAAAEAEAGGTQSGLAVERTDADGNPVPAPDDAG